MGKSIFCHSLNCLLEASDSEAGKVIGRLEQLFPPIFTSEDKMEARVFEVACPQKTLSPLFPAEPVYVSEPCHRSPEEGSKGRVSAIGFLNGLLLFFWGEGRAKCLLFSDEGGVNFLTGSAHRLFFVAFSLWAAERGEFLVHSAAVRKNEKGYLFWGSSGAGKSTISRFFPSREVFSDEAPLIFRKNGAFYCARTPFCQQMRREEVLKPDCAPVERSFFLHPSTSISVQARDRLSALAEIVKNHIHSFFFIPAEVRRRAFDFFYDFCRIVPAFDLFFSLPGDISGVLDP
ncbi:MAG TPA: hypothetical protein PLT64_08065 [Syntrophales bacterium]|nr:hypothetical protein [Syntrophales bacterium]HOL59797.1 hypothetical protein [Syntrophales bacterium]HPO35985.1 hypothetical protein [Syntrophales bacterium]